MSGIIGGAPDNRTVEEQMVAGLGYFLQNLALSTDDSEQSFQDVVCDLTLSNGSKKNVFVEQARVAVGQLMEIAVQKKDK